MLDGSDNFATRYALSDACYYERRPLVSAALGEFDGTLTTLKPYENGPDGRPNPTYRCLFPDPPEPGTIPTCAEAGVLGALGGVLGSLMALEAIRAIVGGFGDGDEGPRRAAPHDRRARDALRDAALRLGRGQSAERVESLARGLGDARSLAVKAWRLRSRMSVTAGRERTTGVKCAVSGD